ncbi:MAG: Dabb family protein [Oscillospiraceae bacterium]|nr:Dabb family protein [Oscillospiraceae bacterium]
MIKHVVMWKFKEGTEKEMNTFLDGLRGLYGVIPQIRSQEVGVNVLAGNYDAVLISTFDSLSDLEAYKNDPRHVAVAALCKEIRTDRVAVDFEV